MTALPQDEPERRVAPRIRTLKRGKVIFNDRFSTFDCIVRNISATGALLTIDEAAHLPKLFEVRIGEEAERPAKLVYRRGVLAGIRFLDVATEDGDASVFLPTAGVDPSDDLHSFGPGDPFHDRAVSAPDISGAIRRIVPEELPKALTDWFRWF